MVLNKKGQMEMVGLVIIVILITLGMLFMAIFALQEEPVKKVFTREGLAYSTMSAMMKTTTDECGTVSPPPLGNRILEDCAKNFPKTTFPDSNYLCGNPIQHSCDFFNATASDLLEKTLGKWNKRYEFRSTLLSPFGTAPQLMIHIVSKRGGCPVTVSRDTSGLFPIQSEDVGLIESVLYVCD